MNPTSTPATVRHLTGDTFAQTIAEPGKTVLVDFWAAWCPPCRALAPTLDKIAATADNSTVIAKLDVDEARAIARQFDIQSIPTMIIFKDGREVDRLVGLASGATITQRLQQAAGG